ncbi:MAG: S9 family peptidase [Gammaproteobacteria bacterium]|nr:S9 family peptidase [Gammaproteobacteria bacterium]
MTRSLLLAFVLAFMPVAVLPAGTAAPETPLIARDALFGNPERTQARISPDGRHLSWIAPRDGVLNVWVAPVGDPAAARAVTNDRQRGIRQHFWMPNGTHVLYLQDQGGDENWRLHGVEIATGNDRDLTPLPGVQAQLIGLSPERPGTALVGLNDRVPEWHDVYEIDVATAERKLVLKNEENLVGFTEDLQLVPRLASRSLADGDEILRRTPAGWERVLKVGQADTLTTGALTIEQGGRTALLQSSVDRNTSALVRLDLESGAVSLVAQDERADIADVWLEPRTRALQAYSVEYLTVTHSALDPAVAKDIEALTQAVGAGFAVTSRTLDDRRWVIAADQPERGLSYHLYDRDSGGVTKLFDQRPALAGAPLVAMTPVEIKSRDGLTLVGYLSRPQGATGSLPLVLNVHGGPWARDSYGFDSEHQWLANRGYAVLAVNYRGSTGFGKAFVNAGDREWAGRMHDDLIDAIDWAVREGITTPERIAIYGGSYGGYATLVGLTFTPTRFACGVDIVGPSNLETLLASIPLYWKSFFEEFSRRIGDPRTEEGKKLLAERSPLTHAAAIARPLLIAQGANDPRVKQAESDQIVAAMKAKGIPVTYVLYPDEGHGFARPQNRNSFFAISEAFLAECLGGRFEPVGRDFEGSSLEVKEGAKHVPGLETALAGTR